MPVLQQQTGTPTREIRSCTDHEVYGGLREREVFVSGIYQLLCVHSTSGGGVEYKSRAEFGLMLLCES